MDANTIYSDGVRVGAEYRGMLAFVAVMWFVGFGFISALRWKKVGWKVGVRI